MTEALATLTAVRRASATASPGVLEGTAVVYNTPTTIPTPFGSFEELIAPGALSGALQGRHGAAIALLRDHNSSLLLARRWSRTLELTDTVTGLRMRATMPPTPLGQETLTLVGRRDLRGMSFSFTVADDGDTWHEPTKKGGLPMRVIHRIERLYEVTICTFPAYEETTVDLAERTMSRQHHRRRRVAARMAMAGGPPLGRECRPPRDLWTWCRHHPGRTGTQPRP